eukprot:g20358.t1
MSDWVAKQTCVTTATANEKLFTKKEVRLARTARDLIKNAAYPSEKDAVNLVQDGNVKDIPVVAADIHRSFDIYGKPHAAVRGKKTAKRISRALIDPDLKQTQHAPQTLIDAKIRRLKESIRSVHAGLPWILPQIFVKDLMEYAVSRYNLRQSASSGKTVSPRVAFTGRKPNYQKELALGFGDYVECYNPKVTSNDATMDRTEPSLMFLKAKFDGLGRFEKIKARLVANGAQQDKTLYPDNSSPTAAMQSILMMLTVAAKEKRKIAAIDIGGAYLNAEMTGEEVVMELEPFLTKLLSQVAPEVVPFVDESTGKLYFRLDKALYGCVQSAKLWFDTLTSYLRDLGFTHNEFDPCVMNKMIKGKQCTLVIFVDDILALAGRDQDIDWVVSKLKDRFGDVKCNRDRDLSYLGMHIRMGGGAVIVSMRAYVEALLTEFGVTGVAASPATGNLFQTHDSAEPLSKSDSKRFHTIVAKLLYLAKRLVVMLGQANVLCMSSKQKIVTRDSTEAELVGLSDKCMEVLKASDFMKSQGYDTGVPTIAQDNMSTITLVTKGGGKYRNKHLKVRQAHVKELVDDG